MEYEKIDTGKRLASMFIDYLSVVLLFIICSIPMFTGIFSSIGQVSHTPSAPPNLGNSVYLALIGFSFILFKDALNGRSLGKRALKLQVVNKSNGQPANPFRCIVRNLFAILWPVEIIFVMINPSVRLGDLVAGTLVVPYIKQEIKSRINAGQIAASVLISYLLFVLSSLPFTNGFSKVNKNKIVLDEHYYLPQTSISLDSAFESNLGADVRVYSRTKNDTSEYVSVIFNLKENILLDEPAFKTKEKHLKEIIHLRLLKSRLRGELKFVYRYQGGFAIRSTTLDK